MLAKMFMIVVGWDGLASKFQDEGLMIAEVRKKMFVGLFYRR